MRQLIIGVLIGLALGWSSGYATGFAHSLKNEFLATANRFVNEFATGKAEVKVALEKIEKLVPKLPFRNEGQQSGSLPENVSP